MNSSASNVFRALEILSKAEHPIGVTELGHAIGIPVSSAHRVLATLEQAGFAIRYQASSKWIPGPVGKQLAHSFFSRFRIRQLCLPYLRQLAYSTGETVSLNVRVAGHAIRIAYVSGTKEVVSHSPLGERRTFPDGTASRVLWALMKGNDARTYADLACAGDEHEKALHEADYLAINQYRFALNLGATIENADEISFPVVVDAQALAAITIEGPLRADDGSAPLTLLAQCLSVVQSIEQEAQAAFTPANPLSNPYEHLTAN